MADAKLYDEKCEALARYFLVNCVVAEPRTPAQVAWDLQSLAGTTQEAVEDWFASNPIEMTKGTPDVQ
jgi:hypothetical protein